MTRPLHPHQARAVEMLRASLLAGHRRPVLQMPTGAGKTLTAAAIIESALARGKRIIFTVPLLTLVDQTVARFADEGITDVGVMQGQHALTDMSCAVQVASVQTLARRYIPPVDLVIVDECHRRYEFVSEWLAREEMARIPVVGLSATPWAKGLGKDYDDLVVPTTMRELIAEGYLSPYRVYAPSHPDLSTVSLTRGDFHEGELAEVMSRPALVADVVQTWLRLGENRSTLVFAVDRAHARKLVDGFTVAEVATAYIDAFTKADERKAIFDAFADSSVKVIVSVATLTTGVDVDARCIVLARPTKSEMLYVQIIGRGLRTAEAKDHCLILDHSDTTLRLGFPDAIHHNKLDDGSPRTSSSAEMEKSEPLPKECPACNLLKPAGAHECPSCGFKPERQSEVRTIDGDLLELDERRAKKVRKDDGHIRQAWFSQFLTIAGEREYKPGWPTAMFRDRFGAWPDGLERMPLPVTPEVAGWVKYKSIRFAKGRAKREARAA